MALCALACLLSTRGVAQTADTTPPSVTGISADCAGKQLLVHFSEPLDPASAMDPANYSVSNGTVPVASAKLQPGGTGVLLALASEPKGEGVLGVSNVKDEAGNAMSAQRVGTSFVCAPTTMEVDEFSYTQASLTLINPNGGAEEVTLSGPMTVQVLIGPKGEAQDNDKNGLDDVQTRVALLDLRGNSSLGAVHVTLQPQSQSLGKIEEQVNNNAGILDLPPFVTTVAAAAAAPAANSFFDLFYQIDLGGRVFHPAKPLRLQAVIHHKPPGPGDVYSNPNSDPIDLLNVDNQPTGIRVTKEISRPAPAIEVDTFPGTTAQITLRYPNGQDEVVNLSGPTTVEVQIPPKGEASDTDGDGLDQVPTEMTQLDLSGTSSQGAVKVRLDPNHASVGQIEETANATRGILDLPPFAAEGRAKSSFLIYYELQVGDNILHPSRPIQMEAVISHKPPGPGDQYVNPFTDPVELLDANGKPTGVRIVKEVHTPNPVPPPIEIDDFPISTAQVTLQYPNGQSENVLLKGPAKVVVQIGAKGEAADTDGDGLDQVSTEMTDLNLQGTSSQGPVTLSLNPAQHSFGQIEERANSTKGILDVPPFTATGTADSSFDIAFQVQVGGQTLFGARPVVMKSIITHKPPGPDDVYISASDPIDLLDAQGNRTGVRLVHSFHRPNPPPDQEIDQFPISQAIITLKSPDGQSERLTLTGPATVVVDIPPSGEAVDTDGDGLDQVTTEMVQLQLTGNSSQGPVTVSLNPNRKSTGEIEEVANATPGTLDVPPFTAGGSANSLFDVNFQVQIGGQTFTAADPARMSALIHHKPPEPGVVYINPGTPIDLLNSDGRPTGFQIVHASHIPVPPHEIDKFPVTFAQITLANANGATEVVNLSGPSTVEVTIGPNGETGPILVVGDVAPLDRVATEMTQLDLAGMSSFGAVHVTLDPAHPTVGSITEQVNNTRGILDVPPFTSEGTARSEFAVYSLIQVGDKVLHPAEPIQMSAIITHKPPGPGDTYVNPFTQPVDLLDANGNPTGIKIVREVHVPDPPREIDIFPSSLAQITLSTPKGEEVVNLSGPTTVEVLIGLKGEAADPDGDGLDQVYTEMTSLDLKGISSMGPVRVSLDPRQKTTGQIEEKANNTKGVLDIPPFALTGTADSFFDVSFEIHVGDQVFHPAKPVHMASVIRHKPPAPGDDYVNPFTDPNSCGLAWPYGKRRHQLESTRTNQTSCPPSQKR